LKTNLSLYYTNHSRWRTTIHVFTTNTMTLTQKQSLFYPLRFVLERANWLHVQYTYFSTCSTECSPLKYDTMSTGIVLSALLKLITCSSHWIPRPRPLLSLYWTNLIAWQLARLKHLVVNLLCTIDTVFRTEDETRPKLIIFNSVFSNIYPRHCTIFKQIKRIFRSRAKTTVENYTRMLNSKNETTNMLNTN